MRRELPPLNALRAFEAAARHLSFVGAADELSVTPGAVSHQIKVLEGYLGVQLFRRQTRGIRLTEAGQDALPALKQGFDTLEQAAGRLRAHRAVGTLVVSVAPSFAAKWLIPRLHRFHSAHPGIDVRVDASGRLVDFSKEDVDVAIRYGAGEEPGMWTQRLFPGREELFPVCSPDLAEGLHEPADLHHQVLLHNAWMGEDDGWASWRRWLKAAGAPDVDSERGPRFSTWSMAIQAAAEGQGVALASTLMAGDELRAGRLVRPFAASVPAPENRSFYLIAPRATADHPRVRAFCQWASREMTSGSNKAQ